MDPSGYRAHFMFQLTQMHYQTTGVADLLLEHYLAIPATSPASAFALGKQYDFQFIYEHSAAAAAQANPEYRYAYLPDDIDLSNPSKNSLYAQATVTMPRLGTPDSADPVSVQGSRTAWGVTIMKTAPNPETATRFLQVLLAPGVGQRTLQQLGPSPVSPGVVSPDDYAQLPAALQSLVTRGDPLGV